MEKMFQSGNLPKSICLPVTLLQEKFMITGNNKNSHNCLGFNQYSENDGDTAFIKHNKNLLIHQTNGINIPLAKNIHWI